VGLILRTCGRRVAEVCQSSPPTRPIEANSIPHFSAASGVRGHGFNFASFDA
jgi:hypothetical protein